MADLQQGSAAQIRRATAADARVLAAMRADSSVERKGGDAETRAAYARVCEAFFARELADPRSFLRSWVAVAAGTIVGGASLALAPTLPRYGAAYGGFDGRVRDVYVVPALRRRGIARALMDAVIAGARAERIDRLTLGASDMGAPLYLALGFAYKRDEMVYTGD
jgi:GNAT superfamily N-acetyltransferase